ncbi:MAG: nuclear transport factor 2 family protein [Verrucomicrobiota bacterium]|jgi:hypothetical protein|nr:MAG: nuclear transport factor 2 family protein [Verrucomicrobiota bacterium]
MKSPIRFILILALMLASKAFVLNSFADSIPDPQTLAALQAADDERVSATIAADPARVGAIFSDEFRYAHSSGKVDNKESYTKALTNKSLKYLSVKYEERTFKLVAPTIALMSGRAAFVSENDGKPTNLYLGFLAVYRNEEGHWRFLAWQSCRLVAPTK